MMRREHAAVLSPEENSTEQFSSSDERPSWFRRINIRRLAEPKVAVLTVVVIVIAYLAIVPLGFLIVRTFFPDGAFSLDGFRRAFASYDIGSMVYNSVRFALGATVLALLLGTVFAYIAVRTNARWKPLLYAAAILPLVNPGILETISWIFLASPEIGLLNHVSDALIGREPFNIFSIWGMIWVQGLSMFPLTFLLMVAAFRSMDPSLEESAMMAGARLPTIFRRITAPLAKPALVSAGLIMAVLTLEAFETPTLLGAQARVFLLTSRIYQMMSAYPVDYGQAGAYAVCLLVITSAGIYLQSTFGRRAKSFQTISGKGYRPQPIELGRLRWPVAILILVLFTTVVLLPLSIMVYASTQKFYSLPSAESLANASLDNFRTIFARPALLDALTNSIILAVTTATAVMLFMAVASWLTVRTTTPGRWLVDAGTFVPIMIPGLVLGLALLFVYLRVPLPIYGTMWVLFIAYCTKYMPYGMRYVSSSMYQISSELEESAYMSGATWFQTFVRVVLPLARPGLLAGWIYIVVVSIRELSASILLYTPGNQVASIMIWEAWVNGSLGQAAAMGVAMVVLLIVTVGVAYLLVGRRASVEVLAK